MQFEPNVWGPHYWFFLHTIAYSYPDTPNEVTKRKYYDLLQNMPLFIPHEKIGNRFSKLLDKYPVTPYLDNKESFIHWVHFIHNKYNHFLGKEELSLELALDNYKAQYKPKPIILTERINLRKHYVHVILILVCLFLIYRYSTDL